MLGCIVISTEYLITHAQATVLKRWQENTKTINQRICHRNLDFSKFIEANFDKESFDAIRSKQQTGRPLGSEGFIKKLEIEFERNLQPQKRGPKVEEG